MVPQNPRHVSADWLDQVIVFQDALDHDEGQKSANSGRLSMEKIARFPGGKESVESCHLGARLRGRTTPHASKRSSEKVLRRVLGKGS